MDDASFMLGNDLSHLPAGLTLPVPSTSHGQLDGQYPLAPSADGRLQVNETSPPTGMQLSNVSVVLHLKPHPQSTIRSFRVVFGKTDAVTSVGHEERTPNDEYIVLLATAPVISSVELIDGSDNKVRLSVQAADSHGDIVNYCDAGVFTYITRACGCGSLG
jgi:hypothetical protein